MKSYQKQFREKRIEQVDAAEQIMVHDRFEYRYQLTKKLVDEIFRTLRKSQKTLQDVEREVLVAPLLSTNDTIFSALMAVWENTAFLSDMILRLPDVLRGQYDGHAVRLGLIRWAVDLCMHSPVYDDSQKPLLELVMQETSLAEKIDPNYVNPFTAAQKKQEAQKPTRAPKTTSKKRGPKLSRSDL